MSREEYLKMVDEQVRDARENVQLAEKTYKEAKAKYTSVLSFRQSYIESMIGDNNER